MSKLTTIDFHDGTLFTIEDGDGVFVAVKPISDGLGLKWSGQHDRLNRDSILAEGIRVTRMPSPGGEQETICLRLDLLQGWLFGIDAARVKPGARDRVLDNKRESFAVLFQHFYGRKGETMTVAPSEPARAEPVPVQRSLVTEARQTFGTRAAGSLWLALGLPVVPEMREGRRQSEFGFTYEAIPTTAERSA
ncbi:phage P22, antirepressor protein [Methylobacterium sp. DM1]|nr:phage P22, antirepressor protein [Methylobacterium sp. DM1]